MNAYYNTYNGLGVTLTKEQNAQYNEAYGIAYSYNLSPAPRMEDFANGNGESIIDYYAQQAYAKDPNANNSWTSNVKKRLAEIEARKKAAQQVAFNTQVIDGRAVVAEMNAKNEKAKQQAATLPTVATPPATPAKKTWKDYLPWIIVGGVVAFGAYKMLAGGKKKRR